MLQVAGRSTPQTVCYGTDGGVLGELQHRVLFGPGDIAQAHTNDEWIALEQLDLGVEMFTKIVRRWCCA
jgi:acetylornithine deacetylase